MTADTDRSVSPSQTPPAEAQSTERKRRMVREYLRAARERRVVPTIARREAGEPVPLSAEQRDVWLHCAIAPEVPLYNEAFTIHRRGAFDRGVMERSIAAIIRRHEIWRTAFKTVDGGLHQIVHPELRIETPFVDLSSRPAAEREQLALEIATTDARRPFDLAQLPLLRVQIVRFAPDDHRLYVAIHHIIFDGVSIYRTIVPELAAFYAAYAEGHEPVLPPPPLQYGDYAVWRRSELLGDATERSRAYWRQKLAGRLPALRVPTDRPRPAQTRHRGGMERFALSSELTAALKALAWSESVTLYTLLLAAFKALLHRYTGQEDIVIGGVTDTRRRPELANVVGYFLNGVALRTRPTATMPFRNYLHAVQGTVLDALEARDVPFHEVVRETRPERDHAAHPIFQVLFSIQPPRLALPGWDITEMDVAVGAAKFDLFLDVADRPQGVVGRFLYCTDLFDQDRIRRMIGHWQTVLAGIVADAGTALGRLPLLSAQESRALLVEVNATTRDYPPTTLPAWFEAQVRQTPDAVAVECRNSAWHYRDLHRRVDMLAARLRAKGVTRETLVAVMLDRSLDMVAGLLAVLRAGGAYLPLDPELPPARTAMLLADAQPAIVLTQGSLLDRFPDAGARIVLAEATDAADDRPTSTGAPACCPDDLAYVLYTSGSTGKPKGVEISHRSLANVLAAMRDALHFGADDCIVAVTTISFDIAALELFLPLVTGGRLVVATREEATDPVRLMALLGASRCSALQATPATWRGLVAAAWPGEPELTILCGGETLQRDLAGELLLCGKSVWNLYGPTETTVWSLIHQVVPEDNPVPIGRPLANTRVYVLDANGAPVPVGVPGELFIGGAGLARGYRSDSTLTEGKFVAVGAVPGERLYRTGDMVRFRAEGVLEFLGRVDNEVKIRGYRVALEEVESAIAAHPRVAAAAVRALPDASGESRLVAFVVPRGSLAAPGLELAAFLRDTLPAYMIPSRSVVLSALPLTANGKVDRARLALPPEIARPFAAAPRDDLERALSDIWQQLLGISTLSVHDDFFKLGGHSLLAAMMAAEIKQRTGRDLPLAVLFRAPTIAALAEVLRAKEQPAFSYLVGLRAEGSGRPLFIIHGVFGNILEFRRLGETLRTGRPVYAVQARGADLSQEPHRTIAEMAIAYFDAIRALQPSGPYALAGYSAGGLIAFEVACRLVEAGEEVDLLALIDTPVHERNLPIAHWLVYHARVIGRILRRLTVLLPRQWPRYLLDRIAIFSHRMLLRFALTQPQGAWLDALTARNREMYKDFVREYVAYRPRRFRGKITLFRTLGRALDPLPVWRKVADAVEVFPIAGTHVTIMEEGYVDALARQLSECLDRLDNPSRSTVYAAPDPASQLGDEYGASIS